MTKKELLKFWNKTAIEAAEMLGYASKQSIYQMPNILDERTKRKIRVRAEERGVSLPEGF